MQTSVFKTQKERLRKLCKSTCNSFLHGLHQDSSLKCFQILVVPIVKIKHHMSTKTTTCPIRTLILLILDFKITIGLSCRYLLLICQTRTSKVMQFEEVDEATLQKSLSWTCLVFACSQKHL